MKKKAFSILVLGALPFLVLPAFASASGNHAGGHDAPAHGTHGHDSAAGSRVAPAGQPGDPAKVTRTIEVTMGDNMRFNPTDISVQAGETVRFSIQNMGKIPHEMVIGTIAELKAHAAQMQKMPGMQHAEPNMITLGADQHGDLVWQFGQAGTVDFACLIPGHLEAGMTGKVHVH